MERFYWLLEDRYHLRGNLRQVRTAIRRGLLEGPACGAVMPPRLSVQSAACMRGNPTTPFRAQNHHLAYLPGETEAQNRSRESAVRGDRLGGLV